jgi:moderate conductance mechanosensitive channel
MQMETNLFVETAARMSWLIEHGPRLVIILGLAMVAWVVAAWMIRRLQRLLVKDSAEESTQKLAHTLASAMRWVVNVVIVAGVVALVLRELGVQTEPVLRRALEWAMTRGVKLVFTVAIAVVALKASVILTTRMSSLLKRGKVDIESQKRAETLSSVVRWILQTGILIVATMMVLGAIGVEIGPIIAAAGIVGLAIGFGAQNLVQDVISGFFILLEDQVRVGDVVQLNDKGGLVERITLRTTILRDLAGNVHYVRNGKIDIVTNMTKDYSRYVFEVGVSYRENVDEVIGVLKEVDAGLRADPEFKDDILQPIEVMGLDKFGDSALIIKARTTTKPIKQWRVGREFNRRLKIKFDELGIEIPFPHLTLYPGQDKKGGAPALRLDVRNQGPDSEVTPTGEETRGTAGA